MVESKCQCKRKKVPKKLSKNAVSTALLDNVLGTIAANMKSSDSHNITLTVEQFYGILNEMSDLRSSVNVMEGRLIQLVDDLQKAPTFFGQSLPPEASKPVEESEEAISTKDCNYEKFEKDLSAAQHSISKIMAETTLQREEMSAWRDVLQKMPHPDQATKEPKVHKSSAETAAKLIKIENKIRNLEKKVKELNDRELGNKDILHLESKVLNLRELILDQRDLRSNSSSEDKILRKASFPHSDESLVEYRDFCLQVVSSESAKMSQKVNSVSTNVSKACRSLSEGLTDVQKITVDLISWSDQVHSAFETVSDKLFLPRNVCPRLDSTFHANVIREHGFLS